MAASNRNAIYEHRFYAQEKYHVVRLLRDPALYPSIEEWNARYREELAVPRATASAHVANILAAVDYHILKTGFAKEVSYQDWIASAKQQAPETEIALFTTLLGSQSAFSRWQYCGAPAGFADHASVNTFSNPYVDVRVGDKDTALRMVLAFRGQ